MDLTYERTENFDGEPSKAIEIARNTFLPNGFEIIHNDEAYLEVRKELTIPMTNNRTLNPIEVISNVSISSKDGKISIRAELGGIKKLAKF